MLNTQCEKVENCCLFRSFVPPKIRGSQPISRPIGSGLENERRPVRQEYLQMQMCLLYNIEMRSHALAIAGE